MLAKLLLLFIVVPFVELVLLLLLADLTNFGIALGLVVVTGLAGTLLVRAQGFRTYGRIHQELSEGRMPTEALIDAVFIFVAGALLLTPGMLTDVVGFSLLIPACRAWYRRVAVRWFRARFHVQVRGDGERFGESTDPRVVESPLVRRRDEPRADPDKSAVERDRSAGGSAADSPPDTTRRLSD